MPKRATNAVPTIPDSELDVLKALWNRGQGTVRELLEAIRSAGRDWSYATVATLLDRLESKGLVASDRSELAFVYRPLITEQEVCQRRIRGLVEKLYHGEPGLLVMHLLKTHPLGPDQALQIRAMLDQMAREDPAARPRISQGGPEV
ncbi:MAG: transcriptional regulator [Isosphaeraceae bacterium]|jgi:predicted transcriptional regulator|nr:MAG: transcriptional regulator [Isosphaeraceae bacterium]